MKPLTRREWALSRRLTYGNCITKGHPVYPVGPYLICRSLRCDVLVVGVR